MSALDDLIGWFSPRAAFEREAYRAARREFRGAPEGGQRSYAAAKRGRLTADWRASHSSGDGELLNDLATLRARSRQMVRDNGYVKSALRNLTVNIVGTGIELRATHEDPQVASLAQGAFNEWANEPCDVEGRHDFFGNQKLSVMSMIEGGETLVGWRNEGREPNASIELFEGDQIDSTQNRLLDDGGRVVAGVEFNRRGKRVAFHLFDHHPGDQIAYLATKTTRISAIDYDHVFEAVRISGQARGVPWFHAGLSDAREVSGIEESLRIKRRVEACLTVFRKAAEGSTQSDLAQRVKQDDGPAWERLAPGMVINGKPGEDISVINPSSSGDGDQFMRAQLMKIAASFGLPYSVMTGDVSQANYSSQRAAMVAFWALLDDWVFNTVAPQMCATAFRRRMRVEALKRSEPRLLEVRAHWTPPKRAWVDPLKDVAAEIAEVRAFGGHPEAWARRGRDFREALAEMANVNAIIDQLGIALDSDPRRINGSGSLQAAAGYLAPREPA